MNNQSSADQSTRHCEVVAARLSVIPGPGQIYKGHYLEATGVALAAVVLAGWFGTLLCLAYAVGAVLRALWRLDPLGGAAAQSCHYLPRPPTIR